MKCGGAEAAGTSLAAGKSGGLGEYISFYCSSTYKKKQLIFAMQAQPHYMGSFFNCPELGFRLVAQV